MPFQPRRNRPLHVEWPRGLDPSGRCGPTRHQARRATWVRVGRNLYLPAHVDRHRPEQRAVELAARYPGSAVSGWGALWLHGCAYFDGSASDGMTHLPLVVVVPDRAGRRASPGVRLSYEPLAPDEVTTVAGVPVTSAVRALFDEARTAAGWREGVVAVDMAAAAGAVTPAELAAYADARTAWRRSTRVSAVLPHACQLSMSPNETRLRLVWTVDAGLPPPLVNQDVFDRVGRFVCRPDLLDPVAGLVGEFDGAEHRTARRHTSDVEREERCREVGLEYVKVTGIDILDPGRVATRLLAARSRARFDPPRRRAWRLTAV